MKVLIAGGGIGGLTAALCCLRAGLTPIVMEQAGQVSEIGAGLQLSPNAMKVMAGLGLADQVIEAGFLPERSELRFGQSGARIFSFELGQNARQRWGAPYVHIHRADLIEVLRAALQERMPGAVKLEAKLVDYSQDAGGVRASLANGTLVEGDTLIGADGIHSVVRAHMQGDDAPRFTGNVAWRFVVPVAKLGEYAPGPSATAWVGKGRHGVTYLLRRGELANFVGVVEVDQSAVQHYHESWSQSGQREEALQDFAGWHPTITALIENAEPLFRWALHDRAPLPYWSKGKATLMGDACHPMLPFMAQGAAMAIEDAWVLSEELSRANAGQESIEEALKCYQNLRLPRTSKVQAASAANARTFHKRAPLERLATYGPMWIAGGVMPAFIESRFDWLYGNDVTARP